MTRSALRRPMRLTFAVGVACVLFAAHAAPARADDAATRDAQRLFEQGLELSRHERWSEARDAFARSVALMPRASTYYNLAVSSLELGLGRATLEALDRFDALVEPTTQAEYVKRAALLRERARAHLGTLRLSLSPAHAQVELDGRPEPHDASGEHTAWLDPGVHTLRASADGYVPSVVEVEIGVQSVLQRSLALVPSTSGTVDPMPATSVPAPTSAAQNPLVSPSPPSTASGEEHSAWSEPLPWLVIGALVVAGATIAIAVAASADPESVPYGSTGRFSF